MPSDDEPAIRTEFIDPDDAPNRFVALYLDGEQRAMIPLREAKAIAETVELREGVSYGE
ncbi:MAG: hypothetical protein ACOC9N_01105 [Gemmatimonadota bacterium]